MIGKEDWQTPRSAKADLVRLRANALHFVRRGSRKVLTPPQRGLGFGNFLYLWLHAHKARSNGEMEWVLLPGHLETWFAIFPQLASLSLESSQLRFFDQRHFLWNSRYGADFNRAELNGFIGEVIQPHRDIFRKQDPDILAVNVRRGDYYSLPHFRGTYSFDVSAYIDEALKLHQTSSFRRIVVISDDLDWCALKLGGQLENLGYPVDYMDSAPENQFLALSVSRNIIGANSSFSYWSAYISTYLHGASVKIVMPRFHARLGPEPWAYQLDPTWSIVHDIPGGWDS